jgi:hypothetical protein
MANMSGEGIGNLIHFLFGSGLRVLAEHEVVRRVGVALSYGSQKTKKRMDLRRTMAWNIPMVILKADERAQRIAIDFFHLFISQLQAKLFKSHFCRDKATPI